MKLGQKARCKITGIEGILTSRLEHLNGCVRWCIQARATKEGTVPDGVFVDEVSVEPLEDAIEHTPTTKGGPSSKVPYGQL